MSEPKDLTWNDVLTRLNTFTPQQLAMPACILDMNNEDRDNVLIADSYGEFVANIPAFLFHSGYGYEFDRKPYFTEK